jgi:HEAT repeat protein
VREKAAEALIKIGKAAVPALIVALKGSNWRVLSKVAEALNAEVNKLGLLNAEVNKLGLYLAPEMLENMSLDWAAPTASIGGPVDEWLVKDALVRIGKPAVPPLIAALKDSDSDVRQKAAEALGRIDDDSAVPALKAADREHHVCFNCDFCEALGRLGAK